MAKRLRLDECETVDQFRQYSVEVAQDNRVFESLTTSGFNMIDILAISKAEAEFDDWPGIPG